MIDEEHLDLAVRLALLREQRKNTKIPFLKQDAFVDDPSRFIAAQCTRRAGKTSALAERFIKTMQRHPGSLSRYIALTRDSARDIMWGVLQDIDERDSLNAEFLESSLTMVMPNGAKLRLLGADMKNFIKRLRGAKSPAVAIDEAQDFGPHIQSLIDDVLIPTIIDYPASWLAVTGTPGPVPRGTFFDITSRGIGRFSIHKWSIFENPHIEDAKEFVQRLKEDKAWPDDNPTYLREWQNKWVLDPDSLLIKYNEALNDYSQLPQLKWNYILGVDIGHRDADALALLGWSDSSPNIYLIEEKTTRGQDITALSLQIEDICKRYDVAKIVMDEGALGKKIAEEIRRRKHIPVQPADKQRKMENVTFLNDYLRQGKFKAKKDSLFAQDAELLQIDWEQSTPDRLVVKKGFHSDIIDAVLYAFKESPAFTFQQAKERGLPGTKQWAEEQVSDMEQAAVEHFEAAEQAEQGYDADGWEW